MKSKFSLSSVLFLPCLLLAVALSPIALNAQRGNSSLTPAQFQGAQVFKQRCGVCHLLRIVGTVNGQSAVMKAKLEGPILSKDIVLKAEDAVRQQIKEGSAHMPGFQYSLTPTQINAIVEYLKTVEKPAEVGYSAGSETED
jgi:mono/diheme cytochrome c family protein